MLKECATLTIAVKSQYGSVQLHIVPSSERDKLYVNEDAELEFEKYQLVEGSNYQYEFDSIGDYHFQFQEESEIVKFSTFKTHPNMGSIRTGIYVGQLSLPICEYSSSNKIGTVKLEIRSVKSDYESDYRRMLDDIAEYYTDLVLMQGSPVKQQLEVDDNCSSQTLYQKFSFVRSVIDSESFREAINKIMSNPVRKWTETTVERDVVSVRRLTRKNIKELATASDRINLPLQQYSKLPNCLHSIPRKITVDYKKDSIDNQENQFVKYALMSFLMFCMDLKEKKNASERLKMEVDCTLNQISNYLNSLFFRQVSMPTHLNLNSPVLQRKEGYREVLQVWLMFDFAARLNWTGGDSVYEAGQKNVAVLYEYWLFFKLQELISQFFNINPADKEQLVKMDDDGIDLNIIQGRTTILRGCSKSDIRQLNVAFYYNRTFGQSNGDKDSVHTAGSWTMSMRPDYTLSIWPGDPVKDTDKEKEEEEAERQELITHIHFDAKYRLNKIILEDKSEEDVNDELIEEKRQQELGIYKRADLLKMHAYKDAIRRTGGAYVLYPGTESRKLRGFHEIIPGLGAFSIRPGHWNDDSQYLKQFLSEIKSHMFDRASEREKMSYYRYDTYQDIEKTCLMENLPESVNENRDFIPDKEWVIIAYYKNPEHLQWILDNHKYNMRAGDDAGSMNLESHLISARYLLLHNGEKVTHFIRIRKSGPKVYTRAQLLRKGYPPHMKIINGESCKDDDLEQKEASRIYLVFDLFQSNDVEPEMRCYKWTISNIIPTRARFKPIIMNLAELISKKKNY